MLKSGLVVEIESLELLQGHNVHYVRLREYS